MKALIVVFWIFFACFLVAWKLFDFYVYKISAFAVLEKPLLWLWVCSLIFAVIFSVLQIVKDFSNRKGE